MPERQPRLLMLTHRFPYPPNRGDRIRSYHLLKEMNEHFLVTLASVADEPIEESELQHVQHLCERVVVDQPARWSRLVRCAGSWLDGKSLTENMFFSNQIAAQVSSLHQSNPFDAILVFCSSMYSYVDHSVFDDVRTVVDLVDVDSCKWAQLGRDNRWPKSKVFIRESRCVRSLEQKIVDSVDAVTLVSEQEADLLHRSVSIPATQTVFGVSNGVDADYFSPVHRVAGSSASSLDAFRRNGIKLVFTGVMNYPPNVAGMVWFCRQVLPKLQSELPVSLKIVGRFPTRQIQKLSELPHVEVTGSVPDVRPFLTAADFAISPLQLARGIQNKVLEAMAMAMPVICSSQSAEGIVGRDGVHFMIADDVERWCLAIRTLAESLSTRERMVAAARQLVVDSYSWSSKLKPIIELLQPESAQRTAIARSMQSKTHQAVAASK